MKDLKMEIKYRDRLLPIYAAILGSVDWQRDVRKVEKICKDAYRIAKEAICVYDAEYINDDGDEKKNAKEQPK